MLLSSVVARHRGDTSPAGTRRAEIRLAREEDDMSWTHSFSIGSLDDGVPVRLVEARDAFIDAQRALEAAREDLLTAHAQTNRLWGTAR